MNNLPVCTPEEAGVSSERICRLIGRLQKNRVPMHSLLIARGGKLLFEGYYAPYTRETPHRMFSVTKSMTGLAIGILAGEGLLNPDAPIISYFPEKVPADVHPLIAAMTIRDMLMMRTCHASTTYKLDLTTDWVESFFTVPPTHPAGRLFHYDTSSAHTLCALTEKLSGMEFAAFLKKNLGFSDSAYVLKDPFGVSMGGSGLVCTPLDLLQVGQLLLDGGVREGRQIIPRAYLEEALRLQTSTLATAPLPSEACGYGYQFWISELGTPLCYGMGGQFLLLFPALDLIIVTTADTQGMAGGNQLIYDAVYEELIAPLQGRQAQQSGQALPPDEEGYRALTRVASSLAIEPLTPWGWNPHHDLSFSPASRDRMPDPEVFAARYADRTYVFAENPQGFESMRLSFAPDHTGTLSYRLKGQACLLRFGLGSLQTGLFPGYGQRYAGSGLLQSPEDLYLYFHIIDAYVGNLRMELSFREGNVTVFLKKVEESLFGEYNGHLYGTLKPE